MKPIFVILLSVYTTNVFAGYGGNVGRYDNRQYGSLSDLTYRGVVKLTIGNGGRCTGTFVSKNLILTNSHCAVGCTNGGCRAEYWNGGANDELETSRLTVVAVNKKYNTFDGTDWAVLKSDKESNFYKPISPKTTTGPINRGGFGCMRIIKDGEIPFLRSTYAETQRAFNKECKKEAKGDDSKYVSCINKHVNKALKDMGREPLFEDSGNFKIQNCNITGTLNGYPKMVETDCDSSGGDSGCPYLRGGQLVALNNSGPQNIFNDNELDGSNGLKTENFYDTVKDLTVKHQVSSALAQSPNQNSQQQPVNTNSGTNTLPSNNAIAQNQNTNNNNNTMPSNSEPGGETENEQSIEQLLLQRLQDFDCD
jgi:hypothetical protein